MTAKTKTSPRQVAIECVKTALANANDSLYRAKHSFNGKDMHEQYGTSGNTRLEILTEFQSRVDMLNDALKWLETQ